MGLLGAHVSAAGGPQRALARGRDLDCEALQIFVKSPNQWRAAALRDEQVTAFRDDRAAQPLPVVAHAAYLINLAATTPETLERSREALQDELQRCQQLGLDGLVLHPGAHMGAGPEAGLEQVARSLDAVAAALPEVTVPLLLENTAGQGTVLGSRFAELAAILAQVDAPERLAVCLDSAHAFAAGYDLRDEQGYEAMLAEFDEAVGLARLRAWHLNDSRFALGTRRDRHANIGKGEIGEAFFARVVNDARFAALPMILETPLGDDGDGHARDLKTLRRLRERAASR